MKTHPLAPGSSRRSDSEPATVGPSTRMLCTRIPMGLHDEVKLLALRRRTSLQAIVTEALESFLPDA